MQSLLAAAEISPAGAAKAAQTNLQFFSQQQ
jgi:hypothetical protein